MGAAGRQSGSCRRPWHGRVVTISGRFDPAGSAARLTGCRCAIWFAIDGDLAEADPAIIRCLAKPLEGSLGEMRQRPMRSPWRLV
jgi:hypothetical protein